MAVAPPVMATVEALPSQGGEQQVVSSNTQHLAQAIPTMLATPGPVPPSQPSTVLSALPAAMAVTPPVPASMANTVASPTQPAASSTAACAASSTCPDVKIKQEAEAMDTQPGEKHVCLPLVTIDEILKVKGWMNLIIYVSPHLQIPMQTCPQPQRSPPRPPPWTLLQQEIWSLERPQGRSPVSSSMLYLQRRVRWWRPTAQMKRKLQAGPSPAGLRGVNLHPGNTSVCNVMLFVVAVLLNACVCYQHNNLFNACFCRLDEEGVRYVPVRPRPPVTLLRHYRNPWKAAYHHFQRYSDIRVKGQHLFVYTDKNINTL